MSNSLGNFDRRVALRTMMQQTIDYLSLIPFSHDDMEDVGHRIGIENNEYQIHNMKILLEYAEEAIEEDYGYDGG